jgi:hypothetical protein
MVVNLPSDEMDSKNVSVDGIMPPTLTFLVNSLYAVEGPGA